jgi:hypothetical protein
MTMGQMTTFAWPVESRFLSSWSNHLTCVVRVLSSLRYLLEPCSNPKMVPGFSNRSHGTPVDNA